MGLLKSSLAAAVTVAIVLLNVVLIKEMLS